MLVLHGIKLTTSVFEVVTLITLLFLYSRILGTLQIHVTVTQIPVPQWVIVLTGSDSIRSIDVSR